MLNPLRFQIIAASLVLSFMATGCVSAADKEKVRTAANIAVKDFAATVQPVTRFDPYGNKLHWDVGVANQGYATFRQACEQRSDGIGCTATRLGPYGGNFKAFISTQLAPHVKGEWHNECLDRLAVSSWAICQNDIPTDDVNFGGYVVPTVLIAIADVKTSMESFMHLAVVPLTIAGPAARAGQAPPSSDAPDPEPPAPAPASGSGDVEERLLKLKSLLDKGLISQEQYDQKRSEILDSL